MAAVALEVDSAPLMLGACTVGMPVSVPRPVMLAALSTLQRGEVDVSGMADARFARIDGAKGRDQVDIALRNGRDRVERRDAGAGLLSARSTVSWSKRLNGTTS